MKNSKLTILTTVLLLTAGLGSCDDWTQTEPVGQNISTPEQQNPAAYAAYAAKIRAYKQRAHKIFFITFENTERPTTPGQVLSSLPDSTNIIAIRNPQKISEMDLAGMRKVRQDFGTRFLCYVGAETSAEQALAMASTTGFDGFVVGSTATSELISKLGASAGPGKGMMLVLEGSSLHLQGDLHAQFNYNVLSTASAATTFDVIQQVEFARNVNAFTNDQILLASSMTGTIVNADLAKRDRLSTMLGLVADLGPLGGLSVDDIQSDYYQPGGNFLTARKAIKELNQIK